VTSGSPWGFDWNNHDRPLYSPPLLRGDYRGVAPLPVPPERYGDWAVVAAAPLRRRTPEQIGAVLYFTYHLSAAAGI
jgi:hypothetical protein